ncbi:endolytic transglycosylase MltG [Hylemonella gracilis]|uniref:Endolytic murein transglycosylase n=1 Tax=Hylemonella gracilis TaxID=80880 RepID=A0A4P6UJ89_9BURK|nr:endolytic transglycosylase MltG [Hylemonella gracilis]
MFRTLKNLVVLFLLLLSLALVGAVAAATWWLNQPLQLTSSLVDVTIPQGASARAVVQNLNLNGVQTQPVLLYGWLRFSGAAHRIKAGNYELTPDLTPRTLLAKLVKGDVAQRSVTLAEGLTFGQWRAILRAAPDLSADTSGLSASEIMEKLGQAGVPAEGRFFPNTYTYPKGSSDLALLRRAMQEMDRRLALAWDLREPGSPLKTPEEALILASIVEKETGHPEDRTHVAGVFNNRLRIGMRLQTDPTVIYGLGEKFDGNLRKVDLQTDTPWNTYTRAGLPPTPIAMPGMDSLLAAVKPAKTEALYFVARGDGTSEFSTTLGDHNRAVREFQLKRSGKTESAPAKDDKTPSPASPSPIPPPATPPAAPAP